MRIDLQIRDLNDGATSHRSFDSAEACERWLTERPKLTEVLGLRSEAVPHEVNERLKAACRPLDAEETARATQLDRAADEARAAAAEARRREEEAAAEKHRAAMSDLPADAPMKLRYRYDRGVAVAEAGDSRTPSAACLAAVEAWLEERNGWVEGRGQVVGDANLEVYPGALPDGVDDPIIVGTFIPVTAPAADD
ncbi:MAG: hypothetical protein AAF928_07775 [Myxococcota bacterium]